MAGNGQVYVDRMLPFGLRSAPKIFAVADGLEWCTAKEGVQFIFHYMDNFVVLGPPGSAAELGIPLAIDKQDGPTQL